MISVSKLRKHELPVGSNCIWWHPNGITYYLEDEGIPCPNVGGRPVRDYDDVMGCMAEANCELTGMTGTKVWLCHGSNKDVTMYLTGWFLPRLHCSSYAHGFTSQPDQIIVFS